MKTTLKTTEDEHYTQNEWKWKLHSKRLKMKTTLKTSEDENYTQNDWRWKLHSKRVKMRTTFETSKGEKYTQTSEATDLFPTFNFVIRNVQGL